MVALLALLLSSCTTSRPLSPVALPKPSQATATGALDNNIKDIEQSLNCIVANVDRLQKLIEELQASPK